ncbi:unnamed protein product, partial [marine sediment metagenome]
MSRFRDVKNVSVFGTPWTGVQEINFPPESESFDYSADDNVDLRRVDVTKQSFAVTISVQDPNHQRDIKDPLFAPGSNQIALNEVLSISMSESADEMPDSSEDDQWLTYIGVTKIVCEAEVELRDINQILTEATLKLGDKDTLQFDSLYGALLTGLADAAIYERFFIRNAVIVGINPTLTHGDLGSGSISFRGHGDSTYLAKIYNTLSAGGNSGFEKNCGNSGEIIFDAPSTAGSGGDVRATISNAVLTRAEIRATHGGRLERNFTFRAYSSDG